MTTEDALIEQIIRAIADHIGHGMAEKCEGVAKAALAIAKPAIQAEMRAEVERLRTINQQLEHALATPERAKKAWAAVSSVAPNLEDL